MTVAWYPKRSRYFATFGLDDEIQQGDVFGGVPTLVARHPDIVDAFRSPLAPPLPAEDVDAPPLSRVLGAVSVHSEPVIVLPHTCDVYGPEKGRRNRARVVARIERLVGSGITDPHLLRSGEGYNHTFFLPSWPDPSRDADDMFVNFRTLTTVDAAYLSRRRRVARLREATVIALRRRITYFFTDYAPAPIELALAEATGGLIREAPVSGSDVDASS